MGRSVPLPWGGDYSNIVYRLGMMVSILLILTSFVHFTWVGRLGLVVFLNGPLHVRWCLHQSLLLHVCYQSIDPSTIVFVVHGNIFYF
eukprot:c23392_g1_i4 orf=207-470(+)